MFKRATHLTWLLFKSSYYVCCFVPRNNKYSREATVWTHGCPSGVFSGMAMVKEALENWGGRAPATTEMTAGMLRLPRRSAASTVSRYSRSCCSGSPVVRTCPVFLSTSKRPSPPARSSRLHKHAGNHTGLKGDLEQLIISFLW